MPRPRTHAPSCTHRTFSVFPILKKKVHKLTALFLSYQFPSAKLCIFVGLWFKVSRRCNKKRTIRLWPHQLKRGGVNLSRFGTLFFFLFWSVVPLAFLFSLLRSSVKDGCHGWSIKHSSYVTLACSVCQNRPAVQNFIGRCSKEPHLHAKMRQH